MYVECNAVFEIKLFVRLLNTHQFLSTTGEEDRGNSKGLLPSTEHVVVFFYIRSLCDQTYNRFAQCAYNAYV